MDLLITLLYIVFVLSSIVLIVVILLQEGQGGGFGEALGGHGAQTFGVAAKGIQTFTGIVAAIFLASAVGIHALNRISSGTSLAETQGLPADTGAPAGGGGSQGG